MASTDEQIRRTLRAYQRAVTAEPANAELRRKLAGYLAALGYTQQASKELELSTKLLAAQGDLLAAISTCKVLLRLDPERTDVLLFLTRHYAQHPELTDAKRVARPVGLDELDASDDLQVVAELEQEPEEDEGLKKTNKMAAVPAAEEDAGQTSTHERLDSIELSVLTLDEELDDEELDELADLAALIDMAEARNLAVTEDRPIVRRIEVPEANVTVELGEVPRIPLLSSLPPGPFAEVLRRLELEQYPAGSVIETQATVHALDPLTEETMVLHEPALHIVVTGTVRAEMRADDGKLVDLGPVPLGGFFGEFELLTGRRQNVTLKAETTVELLMLRKPVLDELTALYPQVREQLWDFYRRRLVTDLLANSEFFRGLKPIDRDDLAERFELRTYGPKTIIVEAGAQGEGLYLIRDGAVEILLDTGEWVHELSSGDFFGVHAIATGESFAASVRAMSDTTVLILPEEDLMEVLQRDPEAMSQFKDLASHREELAEPMVVGSTVYSRAGLVGKEKTGKEKTGKEKTGKEKT